ncbi:5-Enolpyruvylshikimate-3-phosphate synthase [Caballeronia sordidicola]|uniref:5-Enolpyruvylshikimate-3-phosphate synthase n=1 Tax=Caballeronia sordidicola TaxID=196367 RepID=A0A242M933_CABSO|nr:5-Enolpyruvylshikimate-3-phosphate synthase [Caballeronia sordidicola]
MLIPRCWRVFARPSRRRTPLRSKPRLNARAPRAANGNKAVDSRPPMIPHNS